MPVDTQPLVVAGLPIVLCGPIVRRLTRRSVTVWMALSDGSDVTLAVTDAGTGAAMGTVTASPTRVGQALWLSMLTIDLAAPATFAAGTLYDYALTSPGWPAGRAPDWVGQGFTIGRPLPSFLGMPDQIGALNFAHASCRKPHGGGADGLALLARRHTRPAGPRLHQLLLTGDQIYSDDVAAPLMPRVRRVAQDLIGDREVGALAPTGRISDRKDASLAIGLTSSAASNHLWGYAEFCAMYLLGWSETLWPAAPPTFAELNPAVDFLAGSEVPEERWTAQRDQLIGFRRDLADVRRLLANTPTLMVFDDHEVTDDWNLDRPWCEAIYADAAGKQVVANGLLAYTLFQHWGNVPTRFAQGGTPERAVLDRVTAVAGGAQSPVNAALETALGLPAVPFAAGPVDFRPANAGGAIRFDVTVGTDDGLPCRIVLLDERTMRGFPTESGPCQRVSTQGLAAMLPDLPAGRPGVPTLIVCAAPALGFHFIEHILQKAGALVAGGDGPAEFDLESWTGHRPALEALLARLTTYDPVVFLSGDIHYGFNKRLQLSLPGGNVNGAQLTASSAKNVDTLTIALHVFGELLMRLNVVRTRRFDRYDALSQAQRQAFLRPPPPPAVLPWDDVVDIALGRMARRAAEVPAVFSREVAQAYGLANPQANYAIRHQDDEEPFPNAQTLQDVVALPRGGWDPDRSVQIVRALQQVDLHRIGRVFIGLPQAGVVTFRAVPTLEVVHELLIPVGDDPAMPPGETSVTVETSLVAGMV